MKILASREDKVQYRSFEVKLTKVKFELTDDYDMEFEDHSWTEQNGNIDWVDPKTGIVVTDSQDIYDSTESLLKHALYDEGYKPGEYIITAKIKYTYSIHPDGQAVIEPDDFKIKSMNCRPVNGKKKEPEPKAVRQFNHTINNFEYTDFDYRVPYDQQRPIRDKMEKIINEYYKAQLPGVQYTKDGYRTKIGDDVMKEVNEHFSYLQFDTDYYEKLGIGLNDSPIFTCDIVLKFTYELYETKSGEEYMINHRNIGWVKVKNIKLVDYYDVADQEG